MIAVDTCTLIAFLQGEPGDDVVRLSAAMSGDGIVFPPVVLTELLSRPNQNAAIDALLDGIAVLEVLPGYWLRTAKLRQTILGKGLKSRLGDALIAQSCIDHDVALITRDTDFRRYAAHGGLMLA
jgi:predicted nucleic acid-binding protein